MIRCPVCDSPNVRVVLDSSRKASCSACGARWQQEGSWQRHVHAFQAPLPFTEPTLDLVAPEALPTDVVVTMPDTSPPEIEISPSEEIDEALA